MKARHDLEEMNIQKPLHPKLEDRNKLRLPPACFSMSNEEKDVFLKVLKVVKVPNGYALNISGWIHTKKKHSVWGLKSHDSHILLQQLLPIAARRALPKKVVEVLIELNNLFKQLCSKVNKPNDLLYIPKRTSVTLCHLEKIFPLSFFAIIYHLPIHLAEEALIVGPVHFLWMYHIERYIIYVIIYIFLI